MNRATRRWLLAFTLIVFLVTFIPYGLGFANQDERYVFSGFILGVEDGNSYLAKMMRGWMGDWLFRSPYSPVEQAGLPALLPYVWLGKLTTPEYQHTQFLILFQLFRLLGIAIAAWGTFKFAAVFFDDEHHRHWVVVLSLLGGGLGWLIVIPGTIALEELPLDFISPEAFGFLGLYTVPHLATARGLLLAGLAAYLRATPSSGWTDSEGLTAGMWWFVLALMQPLTVVVGGLVVIAHLGITALLTWRGAEGFDLSRWRAAFRRAFWLGLPALPLMLWTVIAFGRDPYAQAWTAQNILPSPHPVYLLLVFALILRYALAGLRPLWQADSWRAALVFCWLAIVPVLIYIPIPVQRRLAEGVFAALAVAVIAVFRTRPEWKFIRLAPVFVTTGLLIIGGALFGQSKSPRLGIYQRVSEVRAFEKLRSVIPPDSVVLANYGTSNVMPAWLPVRVVTGHGPESLVPSGNTCFVNALMYGVGDSDDVTMYLVQQRVEFIFWSPNYYIDLSIIPCWYHPPDRTWHPEDLPYLEFVASTGPYELYRLKHR